MSPFNLLFELGTEELPPKSLAKLSSSFEQSVTSSLKELKIEFGEVTSFAAPRRLAIHITDVASSQPDQEIERLGPNVKAAFDAEGNPTPAALGFARSNGVDFSVLEQAETPKGTRLRYVATKEGQATKSLLEDVIANAVAQLPIAKRMRWGASRTEFVRPVQWVLCLADHQIIPLNVLGHASSNTTRGHRFHASGDIVVDHADNYEQILREQGRVIASLETRKATIAQDAKALEAQLAATVVVDDDLLDEVACLVEWPVVMTGSFDEAFLEVPKEALISSMKEHQKYFYVVDEQGALKPHFVLVSNIESSNPESVVKGNEKVIRPRLADADFFYRTDLKTSLESKISRLKSVVFQKQLGSVADKSARVSKLAQYIASEIGGNVDWAARAAHLAKADLVSDMVLEFDELQGIAGSYYARHDGEPEEVAAAISEQYLPKFAGDDLPESMTGIALSLADRIDTLAGIFAIGQTPSGSKDPFALRRSSIAILRILVDKQLSLDLGELIAQALNQLEGFEFDAAKVKQQALAYAIERFRSAYSEAGIDTEVVNAVLDKGLSEPLDIDQRIQAVSSFSSSDAAPALAAANKRVANILAKADSVNSNVDTALFSQDEEKQLYDALATLEGQVAPLMESRDYSAAMTTLATLRAPVDAFFDEVMVNADDENVRQNRLALLGKLNAAFTGIADIARLVKQ